MIYVVFHTNLDKFKNEHWPVELPFRPVVGDRIHAHTGEELEVVRTCIGQTVAGIWRIEAELHIPKHLIDMVKSSRSSDAAQLIEDNYYR